LGVWEASHHNIFTYDNLQKRDKILVNRCFFLYKVAAESVNVLLLHRPFANAFLNLAFRFLGVSWVISNPIRDYFFAWEGFFSRKAKKKNARLFPCVFSEYLASQKLEGL